MNIIVHLMFAMTLRRQIKRTMGIRLNLPSFLYGNILPDISKNTEHILINERSSIAYYRFQG